ncbi:MAG: CoA-binding protein [Thermoplasmata archaeon]
MDDRDIEEILKNSKNIAIVGLSAESSRDSYRVAEYLLHQGYRIFPINPKIKEWNGIKAYPDLESIDEDATIDVVDIFRKPESVTGIVIQSLHLRPKAIWMQEGIINEEAAAIAKKNGIKVIMDRCMMKEHKKRI